MRKKLERIAVIGPVYPYKGGISHYTGLLCKNLRERYEVLMVSYSMQYPKILFRREQRDYKNDSFQVPDTKFWLNTANPRSWRKTAKEVKKFGPDLVIFQWWHPYFAPCYRSLAKKLGGIKILFLCHNVFPHERFLLDRQLCRSALRHGDYFITHSKKDAEDLRTIRQDAKCLVAVHPTYDAFLFQGLSREKARQMLGLAQDEQVLLFFGFVRGYKGLKHLIAALPGIRKKLPRARLLVVGDFAGNKQQYLDMIEKERVGKAISIYDGYIPDREVEQYFAASDLVVLPYESATQSGIVQIAYGFERPVVATQVGGLADVVLDGRTGFLVPPFQPEQLAEAVSRFFLENRAQEFAENIRKEADRYSWDRMREAIEKLWEEDTCAFS